MSERVVRGAAWRFGADVDTDVIVPSQYMRFEPERYSKHVMEPLDPDFASKLSEGDVVVAGRNFGIGSSREHAAIGLKRAGVGAVLAASFGRIFYRNAVNQGLPALVADAATVAAIEEGDELEVDVFEGVVRDLTTGEEYRVEAPDGLIRDILAAGGARNYYRP
jgi:3-isopropylmalate dehydratase small subunit